MLFRYCTAGLLALAIPAAVAADVVTLTPSQDNTLYEDDAGSLSNGAGVHFFAGRIAQEDIRRGLVAFEVAATVPLGSTVDAVTLTLTMDRTIVGPTPVALHRALTPWGEGTSDASGIMGGGTGTDSTPGDATWIHTFYDTEFWAAPGGDFAPTASAIQTVDGSGAYTWGSTAAMVADVQAWLDEPTSAAGWVVIGDETTAPTAKRFGSRENADPDAQPQLTVEFRPPVLLIPTLSQWALGVLALLLATMAVAWISLRKDMELPDVGERSEDL